MFKFLRKPTIKASLINRGKNSKVTVSNASNTQILVLLFSLVKQIASMMKIDHRHLINKLTDLDKQIVKTNKKQEKSVRYKK